MKISDLLSKKPVIYSLILGGVLVLLLLNFTGWYFIRLLEPQLLDHLKQQIHSSAIIHSKTLEKEFTDREMIDIVSDGIDRLLIADKMDDYRQDTKLARVFLASPDQRIFIDSDPSIASEEILRSFIFNDSLYISALTGNTPEPELNQLGDDYYITGYAPIFNNRGDVAAILVLEAPATLFSTLKFFEQSSTIYAFGSMFLILIFAVVILAAVRRLFANEQQLHEQSRLAHLGQMAAMVAHEIRNPLSIIKGSADVLRKKYGDQKDELFDFIPEEINRLNRLITDFLQFARKKELALESTQINTLLEKLVQQLEDDRISFDARIDASDEVLLSEDAFRQIMLNIINNAAAATGTDGHIVVRTTRSGRAGTQITISVEDDGSGMSAETLEQIYDPFFTTRATGSGLGMAITRQLVEQMNGTISVHSKLDDGTTVQVSFPR